MNTNIFRYFLLSTFYFLPFYLSTCLYSKGNAGIAAEYLLTFYPDARASGIAGAATAAPGSAASVYYNPAIIASTLYDEVSFFYTPLFYGTKFTYISYSCPLTSGETIAGSMGMLSTGDIEKTNSIGETLYDFSSQESVFNFSYTAKAGVSSAVGVNIKFLSQSIDDFTARAYSADVGLVSGGDDTKIGAAVKNIIPLALGADKLPVSLRLGLMQRVYGKLFLCGDAAFDDMTHTAVPRWFLGSEYNYKIFFLRAGVNYKEMTCGAGVKDEKFSLDYAVSFHTLDITHRFSFALRFGIEATKAEEHAALLLKENSEKSEQAAQRIADEKRKLENDKKTFEFEKEKIEKFLQKDAELKKEWKNIQAEKEQITRELESVRKGQELSGMILKAQKHFDKKEYNESRDIVSKILEKDPKNESALSLSKKIMESSTAASGEYKYMEAMEFYNQGKFTSAAIKAEEAVRIDKNHDSARVLIHQSKAQNYIIQKNYQSAKYELIEAIKIKPDDKDILELLKRVQTTVDMME